MKFRDSFILGVVIAAISLLVIVNASFSKGEDYLYFTLFSLIGGLVIGTCIYFTVKSNGVFLVVPLVGAFIIYSMVQNDKSNESTSSPEIEKTEQNATPAPEPVGPKVIYVEPPPQPTFHPCGTCGGSGRCTECAGRGDILCYRHDTNGDGHCTTCDDLGRIKCYTCRGKGLCDRCGGRGGSTY